MLKQVAQVAWMMAFRDHLADAQRISEQTSVVSGIRERTAVSGGAALLFENLPGSPGHRAAVNVCIRDNLARAWNIDPSELIDLMGWAMANPSDDFVILEETAAPVANIISMPMMFLSGVFFPLSIMPEWVTRWSQYLPLTYLADGMRAITVEGAAITTLGSELLGLAVWIAIAFVIATRMFRWE